MRYINNVFSKRLCPSAIRSGFQLCSSLILEPLSLQFLLAARGGKGGWRLVPIRRAHLIGTAIHFPGQFAVLVCCSLVWYNSIPVLSASSLGDDRSGIQGWCQPQRGRFFQPQRASRCTSTARQLSSPLLLPTQLYATYKIC